MFEEPTEHGYKGCPTVSFSSRCGHLAIMAEVDLMEVLAFIDFIEGPNIRSRPSCLAQFKIKGLQLSGV